MSEIKKTEDIFLKLISSSKNLEELESIRIRALGKKGEVSNLMKSIGLMEEKERKIKAPLLNALKDKIIENLEKKKNKINEDILNKRISSEWSDISRPVRPTHKGKIHPISQVTEEIVEIFSDLGFSIAEGPQIESDWYNFDALNIPPEHPARQEFDTFMSNIITKMSKNLMFFELILVRSKLGIWKRQTEYPVELSFLEKFFVQIMIKLILQCLINSKVLLLIKI